MKAEAVTFTANGEQKTVRVPCSVAEFLTVSGWRVTQVVVEYNGKVIPRGELHRVGIGDGDRIEVIVPVAGG